MDYPCAKFGDFSFSRLGFIMRTNTHTQRITDTVKRFTPATVVGVTNYNYNNNNNNNTNNKSNVDVYYLTVSSSSSSLFALK